DGERGRLVAAAGDAGAREPGAAVGVGGGVGPGLPRQPLVVLGREHDGGDRAGGVAAEAGGGAAVGPGVDVEAARVRGDMFSGELAMDALVAGGADGGAGERADLDVD